MTETIDSYRLLERLGHGPLGETHRARDTLRGRTVAFTFVDQSIVADPSARERFLEAAHAASEISHPHIAALWEVGESDGRLFLASEFIPGASLRGLASGGRFDVSRAVTVATGIAEALADAWRHQIVHGDLRPETVYLSTRDQVKLPDFGFSAWTAPRATTPYHSPEQVLGEPFDHRSDIFSLGALLYELLTGRAPFRAATPEEIAVTILQSTPPPPSVVVPGLPSEVDAIVMKALSKSLDGRYQVAATMAAELRALTAVLEHRAEREEATAATRPKRRRTSWRLVAAALVVFAAATAWYFRSSVWPASAGDSSGADSAPPPAPVLVVAPFQAVGGEGDDRAGLAAALTDDLAARLARIPGVSVLARAAARETPASQAVALAGRVGAEVVLTGTVAGDPGSLRATVRLVRAGTGAPIWSAAFTEGPAGPLMLLEQIVDAALGRLAPVPPAPVPGQRARRTDPRAYAAYLQGRAAAAVRDRARAIALYEDALVRDPELVEAQAALAEALYLEAFYGGANVAPSTAARAAEAASRAVAIDPGYPAAHLARGLTAPALADALDALVSAVTLDPGYAEAWHQIGDQIIEIDPERALLYYDESLRLDPGIDASYRDIASAHQMAGRRAEADLAVAAGRAARADRPWWAQLEARFALERGAWEEAYRLLAGEHATESVPAVWLAGGVSPLVLMGRDQEALQSAARLVDRHPWSCEGRAAWLGLRLASRDRADRSRARSELTSLVTAGLNPAALPEARLCGAAAAAALADERQTARLLAAIGGHEPSLRLWLREATFSANLAFRHRWYPWSRLGASQDVEGSVRQIDAQVRRLRAVAAAKLDPVQARLAPRPSAPLAAGVTGTGGPSPGR